MGKLLQKLVNGIVPTWITKIKSSVDTSPKKLLPYFKGSSHVSSSSPSSTRHNAEVPHLVAYDNPDPSTENDDGDPSSRACVENSVISAGPSLTKEEQTSSVNQKPHKSNQNQDHQLQDHNDPHQPHHEDVQISTNQAMRECDTNSCTPPLTPSSRKQSSPSIHIDKHDPPPQQHQKHCKNQAALEKGNLCIPEENNLHHQEARSGRHNVDRRELCDFLELDREGNVRERQDNHYNYHDKYDSHEAENYKNLYHDLLGLKRKSQYLQEEEGEEGEEEENGGSHRSSNIDTTEWGWKRRRGERGVMSCELPESICCIVGNGRAVVKHSQDPHVALWESMVEMIVGNDIWELGSLEFLLFCYLSLNEPHLHPIIHSSFLQVLKDLEKL